MIAKSRHPLVVVAILILAISVLPPRPTQACGPFFTDAIFVFTKHPDFPLERFAKGQLGVLQPGYARSYLVAAYRNLIGEGLSNAEVTALKSLWDERLNFGSQSQDEEWIKKWNDARAKVPGAGTATEIRAYRNREKPNEYETYLNCQQDSFVTAETTLNERIKRFGADSANVRDWLKAQDIVFSNCGEGRQIPEPAGSDLDALIRSDRVYQIAAANFYAAQFDEAAKQFDLIARDSSSAWRDIAPYLGARALLRKGSLAAKPDEGRPALADAEARLKAVINDKSLSRSHHAAGRLLNLVRLRLHPEEKLRDLARAIVKKDAAPDFKQAVWDYTVLLDKFVGEEEVNSASAPEAIRNDDLTDWILTFQDQSAAAATHAIEQWKKKKSVPWFVAALAKSKANMVIATEFMNGTVPVDRSSPAFASVVFHTARLLRETDFAHEVRAFVDRTFAGDVKNWPRSAVNVLLHERMMVSQSLDEFLNAAQRDPAGFSDNSDGREVPMEEKDAAEVTRGAELFFDTDATSVFNKLMPVAIIDAAAGNSILPANLRRDVTQAAFMRAALLDRSATANQAATKLATLYPELRELLTAYQQATTPEARRFAAAYVALKSPGLRPFVTAGIGRGTDISEIDSYRDNWWCEAPPGMFGGVPETETTDRTNAQSVPPEFLKAHQAEAEKEFATLQALGTAPNYLAQTVISWATKNPADRRVPEALHLAVKSTRYGCTDKDTGRWSKSAFDLLHRKYPNTSWAKETKYWFKG